MFWISPADLFAFLLLNHLLQGLFKIDPHGLVTGGIGIGQIGCNQVIALYTEIERPGQYLKFLSKKIRHRLSLPFSTFLVAGKHHKPNEQLSCHAAAGSRSPEAQFRHLYIFFIYTMLQRYIHVISMSSGNAGEPEK